MLNVQVKVDGLKDLSKHIQIVEKLIKLKDNVSFQEYLKQKCLDIVNQTAKRRVRYNTTNDDKIEEYLQNNKLRDTKNGFEIYNDTYEEYDNPNYGGKFSIALAFEYGVGIVGEVNAKPYAWEYNVNNHNFAWWFKKDGELYQTYGYEGFEVYRFASEEIKAQLPKIINDFYRTGGK